MKQVILDFLNTQRVGVLAVEMLDGSPHAATLHFAHTENPFILYFKTDREYRKSEPLHGRPVSRASFVIGTSEKEMKTLQLDGTVQIVKPVEQTAFDIVYYKKFLDKTKDPNDNDAVYFTFTPTWWRFTDWKTPNGKMILTSDDT